MRILSALLLATLSALPAWAVDLVMVEETGCVYCARWHEEIGPIYPKTSEGRFAPLRRVELGETEALDLQRRVIFTPTFLIVEDGTELARLEGYPGEDFFWPLLAQALRDTTDYEGDPQ